MISRTRFCRIAAGGSRGDAWCTGRIDIKGENRPFLKTVDVTGFSIKLNAFLTDNQTDYLFFVPAANVLPSHEVLFQEHSVQVLSLVQFQQQLRHLELGRKTIIKILGDELELLVACLFTPPSLQDGDIANNPYRGLFVFREQDAEVFFGRDTLVRQCTTNLLQRAFLALIGPSGAGKSSFLRAGLLPAMPARYALGRSTVR